MMDQLRDMMARSTSASKGEGRMKQDSSGMRKLPNKNFKRKPKNMLVLSALDGKGGCKGKK